MPRADRRPAILSAARAVIAERGLEGFRVRAVAERAGMNHATLLHHFPTREALLEGVVAHLLGSLQQEGMGRGAADPVTALRLEFRDLRDRLARDPSFFAVLSELQMRAGRDPAVAAPLARMYDAWRGHLRAVLQQGIAQGRFRADLPVPVVVEGILVVFQGAALHAAAGGPAEGLSDTVDWLADALSGAVAARE